MTRARQVMWLPNQNRSEAGKKGAEGLQRRHEREGLSEAEQRQREEAGRKGGQAGRGGQRR